MEPVRLALAPDQRHRRHDPARLALDDQPLLRDVARALAGEEEAHRLRVGAPVERVGLRVRRTVDQRLGRGAEQLGQGAIDPEPATVGLHQAHRQRRGLEHLGGGIAGRRLGTPDLDLGRHARGQVLEQRDVARRPDARQGVDHAERAHRGAAGDPERHAGVGDPAELPDRGVGAHDRVAAGVLDDERRARGDDVTAERVGQRGAPPARPGLGQAHGALEEHPPIVRQGDQGDGRTEQARREARQPVEGLLGRTVEQAGSGHQGHGSSGM